MQPRALRLPLQHLHLVPEHQELDVHFVRRTTSGSEETAKDYRTSRVSQQQITSGPAILPLCRRLEVTPWSFADRYIADREAEVRQARDEGLRELTAVRDAFDDLSAQGAIGRLPGTEYGNRLDAFAVDA